MRFVKIQGMMIDALNANTLVFIALEIFLVILAVSALIIYFTACKKNKLTQMSGLIQVGITLNEWLEEDQQDEACAKLVLAEYLVSMKDPEAIKENRLDPRLNLLEQAYCRQYAIGELLRRFTENYDCAGMHGDPACRLLLDLLKDPVFCMELGSIRRKNAKLGLQVLQNNNAGQDKQNSDKAFVFARIPEDVAANYQAATGCPARTLCITMQYHARNMNGTGV